MDKNYNFAAPALGETVWLISDTECHKDKVRKVNVEFSPQGKSIILRTDITEPFFFNSGLYKNMAFETEEKMIIELKRRLDGGKY